MIEASIEEPSVLVLSESPKKTHEFSNILKVVKRQSNLVIQRVNILFVDYPDALSPLFFDWPPFVYFSIGREAWTLEGNHVIVKSVCLANSSIWGRNGNGFLNSSFKITLKFMTSSLHLDATDMCVCRGGGVLGGEGREIFVINRRLFQQFKPETWD